MLCESRDRGQPTDFRSSLIRKPPMVESPSAIKTTLARNRGGLFPGVGGRSPLAKGIRQTQPSAYPLADVPRKEQRDRRERPHQFRMNLPRLQTEKTGELDPATATVGATPSPAETSAVQVGGVLVNQQMDSPKDLRCNQSDSRCRVTPGPRTPTLLDGGSGQQ